MSLLAVLALALVLALAGCGTTTTTSDPPPPEAAATTAPTSSSTDAPTEPETEETETETEAETETADDTGGYTGLVAVSYETARDVCAHYGVAKIAKDLGVARNLEAVAEGYSRGSKEGLHRDASYDGCLTGLLNRD